MTKNGKISSVGVQKVAVMRFLKETDSDWIEWRLSSGACSRDDSDGRMLAGGGHILADDK